jgi:hypothetical protein
VRISLIRRQEHESRRHLRTHTETLERTCIFSKSFRPLLEAAEMERYTARLEQISRHAREGQFGCFIETLSGEGRVEVILYDRWFDGSDIHTDELARRSFDATTDEALVASTSFLADVQIWADARNQERDANRDLERDADDARRQVDAEREAASRELGQILAAHAGRTELS